MITPSLPSELLERIVHELVWSCRTPPRPRLHVEELQPADRPDDCALCLLRLRETSQTFKAIAQSPAIWQRLIATRWPRTQVNVTPIEQEEPWRLYARRFLCDRAAQALVDEMIRTPTGRLQRMAELADTQTGETDMLMTRAAHFHGVLESWEGTSPTWWRHDMPEDLLAETFWNGEAAQALRRRIIARRWQRASGDLDFEAALALLSEFRGAERADMNARLAELAAECRSALEQAEVNPRDGRAVVQTIWLTMRGRGYGPAAPRYYHDIAGGFPDAVLDYHHETLPMMLVWTFAAVANRIGVNVHPIGWPGTVMALVEGCRPASWRSDDDRNGTEEVIVYPDGGVYFSPYENAFSTRTELSARLDVTSLPAPLHRLHLDPAPARDMVARSARNMLQGDPTAMQQQFPDRWLNADMILAMYAALVALHATGNGSGIVASGRFVSAVLEEHPLELMLLKRVAGVATSPAMAEHGAATRTLQRMFAQREAEDSQVETPKLRSQFPEVQYGIGTIFRHKKYEYLAVITEWDESCKQTEEWQQFMRISDLAHGANQPYYSSWRADNGGEHYVAQDNIEPLTMAMMSELAPSVLGFRSLPRFGAVFAHYCANPPRFAPAASLRAKYPED